MNRKKHNPIKLWNFIITYKRDNGGKTPSYREMMRHLSITTTSVVAYQLDMLEEQNLIIRRHRPQSSHITIPGEQWRLQPTETPNESPRY